jgi:TonB family protein
VSTNPATSAQSLQKADRRLCPRLRFEKVAYADFGLGNGGILIDLSEGGLRFQAAGAIKDGQQIQLKFKLPGATTHIEAIGQVAWLNESRKGGGLRVAVWTEQGREQIRAWKSGFVPTNPPAEKPRELQLLTPQSALENTGMIVATRRAGVSEAKEVESLLEAHDKERLQVSSPATTTALDVTTHGLPTPHGANRTLSSNVGVTAKILPRFIASAARQARRKLTKLFTRKWQFAFALGAVLGCLLTLAAAVGVRLLSSTGAVKVASSVPSAASQISQSGPSDPGTFQASHVAQRESAPADRSWTSVSRPASTPDVQDLPKPQPKPDVRQATGFRAADLIERVDPIYPPLAKEQHLEGAVEVKATIAKDGRPIVLTFVSGEQRLAEAAMAAISLWRYKPALLNGQPVESQIDITVDFGSKP